MDSKSDLPEKRIGYEADIPMVKSVFNFREKKAKENWFDWLLFRIGLFLWYYDLDPNTSLKLQEIDHE